MSKHLRRFNSQFVLRNLLIIGSFGTASSKSFFKWKKITSKGESDIGKINITFRFFVFWCTKFVTRFYLQKLYCNHFQYQFFGLHFTHNYKNQNRTRLFGKFEDDTIWQSWGGRLGYPNFSARTVYCFGEALFECKPTVNLVRSPIK